jgi:hypothetical protein
MPTPITTQALRFGQPVACHWLQVCGINTIDGPGVKAAIELAQLVAKFSVYLMLGTSHPHR